MSLSPQGEPVELTKKAIAGFLQWSSSRSNEYTKAEVVNIIFQIMLGRYQPLGANAPITQQTFYSGAYSKKGHATGRKYCVDAKTRTISSLGEGDSILSQITFKGSDIS